MTTPRIAVILCGSGRGDGSEITEAVSTLVHLSKAGATYRCFALNSPQHHVINHATGQVEEGQTRNQMVEAARISRGEISDLATLNASDFDAVIFPGGFGAAKNLCTFALNGAECSVQPQVDRVVKAFHAAGKPIGLICIAPVIGARVLGRASGGPGVNVTVGKDTGVGQAIASWGSTPTEKCVTEVCIDGQHKVVSTPAYMFEAKPHEVFEGIGNLVTEVIGLCKR
ncbi:MAG: isoprenoid biosynthesis glyoxalase ElbB [Planctomycetes bacterium]|nr:isoprenoid biosynthesis glyoxalase ElbB [Planctomycetota bacterium]